MSFLDLLGSPERAQHHLDWCAQNERWVRSDERRLLHARVRAAIDRDYVALQKALNDLAPDTRADCAGLVNLLSDLLEERQERAA